MHMHVRECKTAEMFKRKYQVQMTTVDLDAIISEAVAQCHVCQATKGKKGLQPEGNTLYLLPEHLFSSVCIDFCDVSSKSIIVTYRTTTTYNYILVVVCRLIGYVMAIPCNKDINAQQMAELY